MKLEILEIGDHVLIYKGIHKGKVGWYDDDDARDIIVVETGDETCFVRYDSVMRLVDAAKILSQKPVDVSWEAEISDIDELEDETTIAFINVESSSLGNIYDMMGEKVKIIPINWGKNG